MKGAYFLFTVWIFVLLGFMGSLMSIEYLHTRLSVHHAYHKALQRSMLVWDYDKEFKDVFTYLVPKGFSYDIELMKYSEYPRLLSYRVGVHSDKGYELIFEEVMIEERK